MSEDIDHHRRRFFGTAAMTLAAAQLGLIGSADAQSGKAKAANLPAIKPGTHTSFASLKQIDAGVLNVGYAEAGPADGPVGHPAAWLALRHLQLCRCRAAAGVGRLPGDRPVSARLWHDAISFERYGPQRPAVGGRRRYHRFDGRAQDRESDARRLRLGRADGQHRRGALAGALQGHGLRERLSDRQPGSRQGAVAAEGRAAMVVPILFRHRARPRRLRQIPARLREAHLAARFAEVGVRRRHVRSQRGRLRQSGSRRDRDPQLPLAARPGARRGEIRRPGKAARRRLRSSPCPPSPWKATPTARRTRSPAPTPRNSPANMRTGPSTAASATICRRKRRRPLPKRSSTSPKADRRRHSAKRRKRYGLHH